MQYNNGERWDVLLLGAHLEYDEQVKTWGTNITTPMHAFKYLLWRCFHLLDFKGGLKAFFGRV